MARLFQTFGLLLCVASLTSCAASRPGGIHTAPPVAPVIEAATSARAQVAAAKTSAGTAKAAIAKAAEWTVSLAKSAAPAQREPIRQLTLELDHARVQIDALTAHLLHAENDLRLTVTRATDLQQKINAQTDALNLANAQLAVANAQRKAALAQRNKLAAILAAAIAGAALFLFRKPLGLLFGLPIP